METGALLLLLLCAICAGVILAAIYQGGRNG
jgi:hypothetical protein